MEFIEGQVFIKNISEHIKETKAKKENLLKKQEMVNLVADAKKEIDTLKDSLNFATDKETIESSVYRLKAAELDLNRQLRTIKSLNS